MKDIFDELSKIELEEIKINKPIRAFKIVVPKEWEEKTINDNEEFEKFIQDFYSYNSNFFKALSDEIGEDITEYITSVVNDYLPKEFPISPTLLAFNLVKEGVWYYFIKLGINKIPLYNTDLYNEFNNLLVKQFDKRVIILDLIEDFFKTNISEIKINKPRAFAPDSKVATKSRPDYPLIINPESFYYSEKTDSYVVNDPITGERYWRKAKDLIHYKEKISEKYSITSELEKILEYTNQDTLNPNVFDGLEIKPKVREVLLKIANYFWEGMELNVPYEDVLLLGSSANYNWTENSDIDVHILFNFSLSNQKPENFKKYADSFTQNFNTTYDFKIKNNPIQLYVQDVTEENHSVGVFSLVDSEWIQEPVKEKVDIPDEQIQRYAGIFKQKIDDLINSNDDSILEKIKQLKDEIKDFRQKGLDSSEGEYSIENLVFKELRNSGYLEKLYNWKTEYLNQKLSLPEVGEANIKPYNWNGNDNTYTFTTKDNINYVVEIEQYEDHDDKITIDFGIEQDGEISHPEINGKDLFKVMSTIVDIIRNYVKNHNNVTTLIFSSIAKSGEIKRGETQRDRLYKAFIKRQLNISDDDIIFRNGNYWVELPKEIEEIKIAKPTISNNLELKILDEIKDKVKNYIIDTIEDNKDAADNAIQELINLDKLSFLKENMIEDNYEFSLDGEEILVSPSNIDSIGDEQIREYIEETPEIKKKLIDLFWEFYFENINYNKYVSMVLNEMKDHLKSMTSEDISDVKHFVEDVLPNEEEDINPNYFWEGYEEELGQYIKNNFYKKESLQEGKKEDIKQNIIELSKFLKEKLELSYLPKVKFINNDAENEKDPLGKTAYYDPNIKTVVLYTLGRHPKDITRSFSHEMIHFKQDLEGRLNNIHTQNINEDDYLAELEREAYEKGNMLLRSWENSKRLNEIKIATPSSITPKIHKVESLKDTEYFDADTYMYLLDLGKYYTFVPHSDDFDNPANKLYLISKDIVKKTEDQNDSDLIRFNNDLKSLDLKDYLSNIQKNGTEYIE